MTKNNNSPITEQLEAIIAKAEELAESRNYEDAIELYEQVIEIVEEMEVDPDYLTNLMETKIYRSLNYFHNKEFDKTIEESNQILRMPLRQSALCNVQINRALCYVELGQLEKAFNDCQRVMEIDPNCQFAYYCEGLVYKAQQEYERAIKSFTTGFEIGFRTFPPRSDKNVATFCYIQKAICETKLGFLEDAMESLSFAQILSPDNPEIYYTRGLILEECIESKENVQEVLDQYIYALKIDHSYINAHLRIGNLFSKLEDYQTAISAYELIIKIDPNNEEAYKNRGLLYQKLAQYPEAIADYNQVLKINNNNPEIYYRRAVIYELLGKQELAMLDFKKVSELVEYSDSVDNENKNYELFGYFFPKDINSIEATNLIKNFTVFCEQKQVIPCFSKFFAADTAIMDACVFDKYENEEILIFDAMQECYQKYKGPFYFGSDFEIFIKNPDSCSYSSFVIFNEFGFIIKNPLTLPGFFAPVSSPTTPFEKLFWNNCNYDLLGIAEKDNKLVIVIQPHENLYMGITNMKDDDSFQVREQKKATLMFIYFLLKKYFKIYKQCEDLPYITYDSVGLLPLETEEQTSFERIIELLETTDIKIADFDALVNDVERISWIF
jgi:tetratricopeptide (TPR) repeat protein